MSADEERLLAMLAAHDRLILRISQSSDRVASARQMIRSSDAVLLACRRGLRQGSQPA